MRYSGQVFPYVPQTAPLAMRLPAEVYALDGCCGTGSSPNEEEEVLQARSAPYVLPYPGGRLEIGKRGRVYETMGAFDTSTSKLLLAAAAIGAAFWLMKK